MRRVKGIIVIKKYSVWAGQTRDMPMAYFWVIGLLICLAAYIFLYPMVDKKRTAHLIGDYRGLPSLATLGALHAHCRPSRNLFTPFLKNPILYVT